MAFAVRMRVAGMDRLLKRLDGLEKKVRNQILRKATFKASEPVYKDARRSAPKGETGLLKKSIGRRVRVYRKSGVVVVVVGPRTGFRKSRAGRVVTALGKKYQAAGVNPTRYAHLVEFGRRPVVAGVKTVRRGVHGVGRETQATGKTALPITIKGVTIFAKRARAARPRPFMRMALYANKSRVEQIMKTEILAGLAAIP